MKNNKYIQKLFLIWIMNLIILITLSSCTTKQIPDINESFAQNNKELNELIVNNSSEIDYTKYLRIEMKDSELVYNKTKENQEVDKNFCNLKYKYSFYNISNEPIKINYKIFFPIEMTEDIIVTNTSAIDPKKEDVVLQPQERTGGTIGALMIHYDKLDRKQKEVFDKNKSILYIEMHINGKKTYIKAQL